MDSASLDRLLKAQPALWRGRDRYTNTASIPTGFAALDNALPAHGWSIGGITELLVEQHGIGELSLLLPALRHVARRKDGPANGKAAADNISPDAGLSSNTASDTKTAILLPTEADKTGWAALINPPHIPYAPAFSNAGIALDRLLIVNTSNDINTLWATEQVLRSGLFGAVIAWVQKSSAQRQRRLQLAAEAGNSWGVVYRPLQACKEHSPVSTRICVSLSGSVMQDLPRNSITQGQARGAHSQDHQPQTPHPKPLTLDIFKLRAGNPQIVTIYPEEFDTSQGSEWPVPASLTALRDTSPTTSPTTLRPLSAVSCIQAQADKPDAAGKMTTDH